MKLIDRPLPEVLVLEPDILGDERGHFFEAWNRRTWRETTGLETTFVQDNQSRSVARVLRGVHYQVVRPQGKLVRVVHGAIWDVAVDLRRSSATFLKWYATELSAENHRMMWVPPGFGHGFLTLSPIADVIYKTSEFYAAEYDRAVRYDDPAMGIEWPLGGIEPVVSSKDSTAPSVAEAELFD